MWLFLKTAIVGWLLRQTFGRMLAVLLGALLPLATLLKLAGLPLLFVLILLGAPLFVVLALVGLPLLLVAATVGLLLAAVAAAIKIGLMLLAVAIPVVLAFLILRWFLNGRGDNGGGEVSDGPPPEDVPAPAQS